MNDFEDAEVLITRFQGDDGSADARLRELLAAPGHYDTQRAIVDRLAEGRLLIPVVAHLDEVDESGADKGSHMSTVTITNREGHKALLGFTGVDSVALWREDARPIPVAGVDAAQAALQEDCDALLIDFAGPAQFALAGTGLWALAAGGPWRHPLDEPAVMQAMQDALDESELVGAYEVDPSSIDGVALVLSAVSDMQSVQDLADVLAATPEVQARVSRLEMRVADQ